MPRKSQKKYSQYDKTKLDAAMAAIKSGLMSQRQASKDFQIPQSTLSDYVRGRSNQDSKPGAKPILPPEIENMIAEKCVQASERGFGVSKQQLLSRVGHIAKAQNLPKIKSKTGMPGQAFWSGFKTRHPEITLRTPEALSTVRSRGVNPTQIGKYFVDLHHILHNFNLHDRPYAIWNMDESSMPFEHKPTKVLARKGSKDVPGRASNTRCNNTIIACVNAVGTAMSPLMIVKGATHNSLLGWNTSEAPKGTLWTFQRKAWTEDVLGIEWFQNIFLKQCGPSRPQLLIVDGHKSHEVLGLLETAKNHNIEILCLPAHTTHVLQPLDRTVFGPLKSYYRKYVTEFLSSSPLNVVNKWTWPGLFCNAYNDAFTQSNIVSGFRSTGIYPWNPLAIDSSMFLPSEPFDKFPMTPPSNFRLGTSAAVHPLHWVYRETHPGGLVEGPDVHADNECTVEVVVNVPQNESSVIDLGITSSALPVPSTSSAAANWNADVDSLFAIPSAAEAAASPATENTHAIAKRTQPSTKHRLLTSNEILELKREEAKRKEDVEKEKERKRKAREEKVTGGKSTKKTSKKGKKIAVKKKATESEVECLYCKIPELDDVHKEWIYCELCNSWAHQDCVPVDHTAYMLYTIEKHLDFLCSECYLLE